MDKKEISWICAECGSKYGYQKAIRATWHIGECDICGAEKPVTQPRDFGGLDESKLKDVQQD